VPRETSQPSDAEWKVLNALWREHPANARDLLARLREHGWAYNTLKTLLARMEEKGLVRTEMRGNVTWFTPAVQQRTAQRNAVRTMIRRVFEGASGPLLAHLAEDATLTAAERKKLEAWIAEVERREAKRAGR
jgi:predicted transcriptional regulator